MKEIRIEIFDRKKRINCREIGGEERIKEGKRDLTE